MTTQSALRLSLSLNIVELALALGGSVWRINTQLAIQGSKAETASRR